MENAKGKIQLYILSIPVILLLIYGVIYENPYGERKVLLITLTSFIIVLIILEMCISNILLRSVNIILIGLTLMLIEFYSKYAINYFFHIIYYFEIVYAIVKLKRKKLFIVSIFLIFTLSFKFIELMIIQPTTTNLLLSLFFIINSSLVLVIVYLAKTYREENKRTKELYNELYNVHIQLKDYSNHMRELASYEERTRIARDLHDTLGHEMTGLIMQLEIGSGLLAQGDEKSTLEILEASKKSAREALGKVREIVSTLKDEKEYTNESIIELIENFAKKTKVNIKCDINDSESFPPDIRLTIYRVIQESLTNSVRHGNASNIEVMINYEDNFIKLMIKDDGVGCPNLHKGNGLKGMSQRVEKLNGTINIIDNDGLTILVKIPRHKYLMS